MQSVLLSEISAYVIFLFNDKLPPELAFHNIEHTMNVVTGVKEIGLHCGLNEDELNLVEIAAWLHDTGYFYKYTGHEEESIRLTRLLLDDKVISQEEIDLIIGCIESTRYPQQPKNILEKVICDADFYHFTLPNYPEKAGKLRKEWKHYLHKNYTDNAWNEENCHILNAHKYFTEYGQNILQKLKDRNLATIKSYCD